MSTVPGRSCRCAGAHRWECRGRCRSPRRNRLPPAQQQCGRNGPPGLHQPSYQQLRTPDGAIPAVQWSRCTCPGACVRARRPPAPESALRRRRRSGPWKRRSFKKSQARKPVVMGGHNGSKPRPDNVNLPPAVYRGLQRPPQRPFHAGLHPLTPLNSSHPLVITLLVHRQRQNRPGAGHRRTAGSAGDQRGFPPALSRWTSEPPSPRLSNKRGCRTIAGPAHARSADHAAGVSGDRNPLHRRRSGAAGRGVAGGRQRPVSQGPHQWPSASGRHPSRSCASS